jgi:hypothetical protein
MPMKEIPRLSSRGVFDDNQDILSERRLHETLKKKETSNPSISFIVKSNLMKSSNLPEIYDVTGLMKQQGHQVPSGSFARMINFVDTDRRRTTRRHQTLVRKNPEEIQ